MIYLLIPIAFFVGWLFGLKAGAKICNQTMAEMEELEKPNK